ncbi:hypothetical protein BBD39_02970 [Arsenophonus endosymbiont of Bemisia tabaci Asia II 3]|nr:hypothetical protein BBD39_02970 [Arsenophonus endosymbiont of Bemisia tabaci Asia II 3]
MRVLSVIILSIFMSLCLVKSSQAKEYQLKGKNINSLLSDNKKGILLWFKITKIMMQLKLIIYLKLILIQEKN